MKSTFFMLGSLGSSNQASNKVKQKRHSQEQALRVISLLRNGQWSELRTAIAEGHDIVGVSFIEAKNVYNEIKYQNRERKAILSVSQLIKSANEYIKTAKDNNFHLDYLVRIQKGLENLIELWLDNRLSNRRANLELQRKSLEVLHGQWRKHTLPEVIRGYVSQQREAMHQCRATEILSSQAVIKGVSNIDEHIINEVWVKWRTNEEGIQSLTQLIQHNYYQLLAEWFHDKREDAHQELKNDLKYIMIEKIKSLCEITGVHQGLSDDLKHIVGDDIKSGHDQPEKHQALVGVISEKVQVLSKGIFKPDNNKDFDLAIRRVIEGEWTIPEIGNSLREFLNVCLRHPRLKIDDLLKVKMEKSAINRILGLCRARQLPPETAQVVKAYIVDITKKRLDTLYQQDLGYQSDVNQEIMNNLYALWTNKQLNNGPIASALDSLFTENLNKLLESIRELTSTGKLKKQIDVLQHENCQVVVNNAVLRQENTTMKARIDDVARENLTIHKENKSLRKDVDELKQMVAQLLAGQAESANHTSPSYR